MLRRSPSPIATARRSARRGPLFEDPANETPKPGEAIFARNQYKIIMTPAEMIATAAASAARQGYEPHVLGADVEGEPATWRRRQRGSPREAKAGGRRVAILSGGELTVTNRRRRSRGPNQEFALALALALDGLAGVRALARRHRRHRWRRRRGDRPGRRRHRRDDAGAGPGARSQSGPKSRQQ